MGLIVPLQFYKDGFVWQTYLAEEEEVFVDIIDL